MDKSNLSVLEIEDNPDDAELVRIMLNRSERPSFTIVHAERLARGIEHLKERPFDVILLDLGLPDSSGFDSILKIRQDCPEVPLIILTGQDDEETAVKALQMDVQDYLIKGRIDADLLVRSIRYARERKRTVNALRRSESRLRRLSESGIMGIAYFDLNGRISDANDTFLSMIGYGREEIGRGIVRLDRLLPAEWRPHMYKVVETFLSTGRIAPYETEYLRRDGSRWWGLFGAAKLEGVEEGIAFVVDITKRKNLEKEIRHMADHDVLTGLPNRRLFLELFRFELEEARRNRSKVGLLFLDLDRFKGVNDTMGHEAGDELLRTVAQRLRSVVRKADSVARIGGDEFSILLGGIACRDDVAEIVRKILAAFDEKCNLGGREFRITTSIGISIYPDDSEDIDTLFRYSDMALYRAKDRGRNISEFYNPKTIENCLRKNAQP